MLNKTLISIFLCLAAIYNLAAQQVVAEFPLLADKQARLYYFTGARVDSVLSVVDTSGKAIFDIPDKGYRGMATLVVAGAGAVELVVAEPSVQVVCHDQQLNTTTALFPHSRENNFLKHIFTSQSRYMQQQAWLQAAPQLFGTNAAFLARLEPELDKVNTSMQALDKEITISPLYSARYYHLSDFMNRLFDTEQKRDSQTAVLIRQQMEEELDIASLYHSGQLWNSVLNFYCSLFNHTAGEDKQQQYAASVQRTLQRLPAHCYEAFLAGCITETERFGWRQAQELILSGLHPQFTSSIASLQRALGTYRASSGGPMPPIVGLSHPDEDYSKTLVAFYDSDCSTCVNEMFRLVVLYPKLKAKGVRVISIAADTDKRRYEEGIRNFPWQDKVCDFKGFEGINFSNYNVIGSPSFYLLDKDNKLIGVFFSTQEVQEMCEI